MTPVACLASPALPMTTSTGTLPPSGQVWHYILICKNMQRMQYFTQWYIFLEILKFCVCVFSPALVSGAILCLHKCKQQYLLVFKDHKWHSQLPVLWVCHWFPGVFWSQHRSLSGRSFTNFLFNLKWFTEGKYKEHCNFHLWCLLCAADERCEHAWSWCCQPHAWATHETAQLQRSQRVQSRDRWVISPAW